MEIGHIPMGFKNTCIPREKLIQWENYFCGVVCNMKYVLEKMVNVFSIFPLQTQNFNLAYQTSQEAGREHYVITFCQVSFRSVQRLRK